MRVRAAFRLPPLAGAVPFAVVAERGDVAVENVWYRDYVLARESERGLDDRDDNLAACTFAVSLAPGESVTLAMGVGRSVGLFVSRGSGRLRAVRCEPLERAAAQFVVRRPVRDDPDAYSIVAGYHWFGDWGRDTAISLPGLTLATGTIRYRARKFSRTLAGFVDGGMLPNIMPAGDETPVYNTVDAALWFVEAAGSYLDATGDRADDSRDLAGAASDLRILPRRHALRHTDGRDGLIVAAATGVQLTWMDAKVGDWVVTPRMGKPVEIAALWYNALKRLALMAPAAGELADEYAVVAERARAGFTRFWNASAGYCFDVIDGPDGNDATLRPNQIFAVSLPNSPLSPERQRAVVDVCAAQLLTTNGLRTLPPSDPRFVPRYGGSQHDRDAAYHQGTVWPWLLGPFAVAHARVYGDAAAAHSFLDRLEDQLTDYGFRAASRRLPTPRRRLRRAARSRRPGRLRSSCERGRF